MPKSMQTGQQEHLMTSFLIAEGGGRACNGPKFENLSPTYTKNRTHLHTSLQFHSLRLTMHCYPCNQQDVSTPSLPGKFYLVIGPS